MDGPADGEQLQQLFNAAFARIALVHRLMSFHDAGSDVSRINLATPGEVIAVDAHTVAVLALAEAVRTASAGAFNIACAPVLVASGHLPAPSSTALGFTPGKTILHIEDDTHVRKLYPGWIDLGGIAKGYAVDLAIETLVESGTTNACVNAGGDLRVSGEDAWPVIIRDGSGPGVPGMAVELRNEALASSATYFSMRDHTGFPTSALIDASNGKPLSAPFSCSVCAGSCAVADALTKVVAATRNPQHAALAAFSASALIM